MLQRLVICLRSDAAAEADKSPMLQRLFVLQYADGAAMQVREMQLLDEIRALRLPVDKQMQVQCLQL